MQTEYDLQTHALRIAGAGLFLARFTADMPVDTAIAISDSLNCVHEELDEVLALRESLVESQTEIEKLKQQLATQQRKQQEDDEDAVILPRDADTDQGGTRA